MKQIIDEKYRNDKSQNKNLSDPTKWYANNSIFRPESLKYNFSEFIEEGDKTILPDQVELESYPNPFNPQTQIKFYLPGPGQINLSLFDINGRSIQTLADGHFVQGDHSFEWNPAQNQHISSGVYLAMLQTGTSILSKKILYLK